MEDNKLLLGKKVAEQIYANQIDEIRNLKLKDIVPHLAVLLIGDNSASRIYVKSKTKIFKKYNCLSTTYKLEKQTKTGKIVELIKELNHAHDVHGILVQLPLPKHVDEPTVLNSIDPNKDVDGFHPFNLGLLMSGSPNFIPCTPLGIIKILEFYKINTHGKHIVVVGRSNIVGKPIALLLAQKFEVGNSTVTICHSSTKNIGTITSQADVLIVAIGSSNFINSSMIKNDAVIVDVGINRLKNKVSNKGYDIVGDVDYHSVIDKVKYITPVPGGVGPMTIAMLLHNTIQGAKNINSLNGI